MEDEQKNLAICQMVVLNIVLHGDPMDIETAIQQLSLDNIECLKLAEDENLEWIAENIREIL